MASQPTATLADFIDQDVTLDSRQLRLIHEALLTDAGRRQAGSPIQRELANLAAAVYALRVEAPRDGYRLAAD